MKTIICIALCMLAVSALSPIENLHSALDLIDMPDLLDGGKGFDLSVSLTYLGGPSGDDGDVAEQIAVQGSYNLLTWEDDKGKTKTGTFNKTKEFTSKGVVKFTGSGTFNARGGGSEWKGFFNGGSSTDLVFESDAGYAYGIREHEFAGEFKGKKNWGKGNIQFNVWQDVNNSANTVEYGFGGDKDNSEYSGNSKVFGEVNNGEQYEIIAGEVFHGKCSKDSWKESGGYVVDVYDSDWNNVYSKSGSFNQSSGSAFEAFGGFRNLRTFGLPTSDLITE